MKLMIAVRGYLDQASLVTFFFLGWGQKSTGRILENSAKLINIHVNNDYCVKIGKINLLFPQKTQGGGTNHVIIWLVSQKEKLTSIEKKKIDILLKTSSLRKVDKLCTILALSLFWNSKVEREQILVPLSHDGHEIVTITTVRKLHKLPTGVVHEI